MLVLCTLIWLDSLMVKFLLCNQTFSVRFWVEPHSKKKNKIGRIGRKKFYKCHEWEWNILIIGTWCNGNIVLSKSIVLGSNPSVPAIILIEFNSLCGGGKHYLRLLADKTLGDVVSRGSLLYCYGHYFIFAQNGKRRDC